MYFVANVRSYDGHIENQNQKEKKGGYLKKVTNSFCFLFFFFCTNQTVKNRCLFYVVFYVVVYQYVKPSPDSVPYISVVICHFSFVAETTSCPANFSPSKLSKGSRNDGLND